jgi:CRP-like cAMP-binding protein
MNTYSHPLRTHFLFKTLDDEEWQDLQAAFVPRLFQPAQILFEEGDHSQDLYVLQQGVVELRRQFVRHAGDYLVASLHPPHLFGEASLLSHRRRTMTAIAITDTETLTLSPQSLVLLPLGTQLKIYRAWGVLLSEQIHWLEPMLADLLEERGTEILIKTITLLQQRLQNYSGG